MKKLLAVFAVVLSLVLLILLLIPKAREIQGEDEPTPLPKLIGIVLNGKSLSVESPVLDHLELEREYKVSVTFLANKGYKVRERAIFHIATPLENKQGRLVHCGGICQKTKRKGDEVTIGCTIKIPMKNEPTGSPDLLIIGGSDLYARIPITIRKPSP